MSVDARRSGLDVFAAKSDLISPGAAQLQTWERNGLAYCLVGGEIVPAATTAQLNAAILRAKAAFNDRKGPEADPAFRRFLETRCRMLGVPVPDWSGVDGYGYSGSRPGDLRGTGAGARPPGSASHIAPYDGRSADAGKSAMDTLAKLVPAGSVVTTPDGRRFGVNVDPPLRDQRFPDGTTPSGRAAAEARKFERKASQVSDPVSAAGYRALAKQRYEEAGL